MPSEVRPTHVRVSTVRVTSETPSHENFQCLLWNPKNSGNVTCLSLSKVLSLVMPIARESEHTKLVSHELTDHQAAVWQISTCNSFHGNGSTNLKVSPIFTGTIAPNFYQKQIFPLCPPRQDSIAQSFFKASILSCHTNRWGQFVFRIFLSFSKLVSLPFIKIPLLRPPLAPDHFSEPPPQVLQVHRHRVQAVQF